MEKKRKEMPVNKNEKQLAGREYWENKFREMAQKGLREIPGVREHIDRFRRGKENTSEDRDRENPQQINQTETLEDRGEERRGNKVLML